jgi:hypothetical protein
MLASRLVALSALSLALVSTAAWADETASEHPGHTVTLETIRIKGRPARPSVAVAVNPMVPRAPLPQLRRPLVDSTGAAIERDPF